MKKQKQAESKYGPVKVTHLSDHCIIDHFEKVEGQSSLPPRNMLLRFPLLLGFMLIDRLQHFTGVRGALWRFLGVSRSAKNPNICNI